MLSAIIEAFKAIIGLRQTARQDKKVGLEIEKLETDIREKARHITPATLEEVSKYDPKYRSLIDSIFGAKKKKKKKKKKKNATHARRANRA